MLPASWDADQARRGTAQVPASERRMHAWQHMLSAVGEMAGCWRLPPAPVIADLSLERTAGPLARGLETLGVRYALKVAEDGCRDLRTSPRWHLPPGRSGMPSLLYTQVPAGPAADDQVLGHFPGRSLTPGPRPARYVAAEWPAARRAARTTWLTTLGAHFRPSLTALTLLNREADAELESLYASTGLLHFEGRSFPGWHHYVTLVPIARAWSHRHGTSADVMLDTA